MKYSDQVPMTLKKPANRLIPGVAFFILGGCAQPTLNSPSTPIAETHNSAWIATAELSNPSEFARTDEGVYFSFYDLGLEGDSHALTAKLGEQMLPAESIDRDGDGRPDGLLTLVDFAAGETRTINIVRSNAGQQSAAKRTQAEISIKQGGHWVPRKDQSGYSNYEGGEFVNVAQVTVPEYYTDHSNWIRYEGPGIESDRVGYRVYLDGRNGFDIFGKSTAEPILHEVGLDGYESYHQPQPWGMDILKVGKSLGAGGFGIWQNSQLVQLEQVRERCATIRQNGNLFSGFTIHYGQWQVKQKSMDVDAWLSMQAGSRLVRNQVQLSEPLPNLAIGLVAHAGTQFIEGPVDLPGDAYSYIASWGPQSLDGKKLGMAVFYRRGDRQEVVHDGASHLVTVTPAGNTLTYYFAAAWEGEHGSGIATETEFREYLHQEAETLTRPVRQRLTTRRSVDSKEKSSSAQSALAWSQRLADAELQRKAMDYHAAGWDVNRKRPPKFEYDIVGLLPFAYDELAHATGDARYGAVKHRVTASFVNADGSITRYNKANFNIDSIAPGRALLRVYQEAPESHYLTALATLREQLNAQPKTGNGAFWHKQVYPGQLWLDGVYMGMPFLAEYAQALEHDAAQRETSLDEVMHEFRLTEQLLKDPVSGLYYHAWDEHRRQDWADSATGLSPHFWGRGMGWLAMALVDVLDALPAHREQDRQQLIAMSVDLARALQRHQDHTGTWWQIMDRPGDTGNYRESSASAMFTYFLAKAARQGYLTEDNVGPGLDALIRRSYDGLIKEFVLVHADGTISMTSQCLVAGLGFGRDGSYAYYMNEPVVANDPKGTGPFILAGVEVHRYLNQGQQNDD